MVEIRGAFVNDTIASLKKRDGDQAYSDVVSRLYEQSRRIFEAGILDMNWYPLDSFLRFLKEDIELTAHGDENILIARSETLNEEHIRDIYLGVAASESPQFFIKHISIVHQLYFRGVAIEITFNSLKKAVFTFTGFEKHHVLIEPVIIGFYKKVLETSGAKDIHTQFLSSIRDNKKYAELEITWA